ncbi:MAG: hypothetical protein GYB55_19335 [Cytophagales bacterium]|nr:hypothetical protein [Cytophagales bacterium]
MKYGNSNFREIEFGIRFLLTENNSELRIGEKIVLITVVRLLEERQIISKKDVCVENGIKNSTTYAILKSLENKGYLKSQRDNQYYSKSYITILRKGLLFKVKLRNLIR